MNANVEITDLDRARVLGSLSPSCPYKLNELARDCGMTTGQVVTVIREARNDGWPIFGTPLTGYLMQLGRDSQYRECREWLDASWDQMAD